MLTLDNCFLGKLYIPIYVYTLISVKDIERLWNQFRKMFRRYKKYHYSDNRTTDWYNNLWLRYVSERTIHSIMVHGLAAKCLFLLVSVCAMRLSRVAFWQPYAACPPSMERKNTSNYILCSCRIVCVRVTFRIIAWSPIFFKSVKTLITTKK